MSFNRLLARVLLWRGLYFLSAFLLNILLVRYYGAAGSSTVYYLISLYTLVLLIAGFSLESGMSFFLARGEAGEGELSSLAILWTVIFSLVSLPLLKIYFLFFDADIARGLFEATALTFIPGQLLITYFTALFYAKEASVLPNMLLVAVNLLLILLIPSAGIVHTGLGAGGYLKIYFWGILVQGLLLATVFAGKYGRRLRLPDRTLFKKIFRYSLIALTANVLFFLVYRVDYWFVKRFCTADQLGNYIQVSKLGQIVLLLPGILASVIFPRTALGKHEDMARALTRMIRIAVLLFCLVFIIVFFTGRTVFPLVFGRSLDQMYLPMLILLPGVLFLSVLSLLSAYFGGIHRPDVNAKGALAGLIVIIIGDMLVIPRYNIAGAAAVSSAGYLVCMLYSWREFKKVSGRTETNG